MITVQLNMVSMVNDNRQSKLVHTARTLEEAKEYFKDRIVIREVLDETQQKHVKMFFRVESVELAQ